MGHIKVRGVEPSELRVCEELVRDAFWNVYRPGCSEHLIWHNALAGHPDLLPGQALAAAVDGYIAGCLLGTRAHIEAPDGGRTGVVVLGPLGVRPAHQGQGVGSRLMTEALARARADGEPAAFLYGNPAFYGRFGFEDAGRWAVTTADGDNFPAFMGLELQPDGLAGVRGRLVESTVFAVDDDSVAEFDAGFPPREKLRLAGQL